MKPLIEQTDRGLYCAAGDFYIDPWRPVARAVITHAHADHARPGSRAYLSSASGAAVLRERIGAEAPIEALAFGQPLRIGGVTISLHPAGHLLGSAQVRVERGGEVWVVSGDFKTEADRTCEPFEPVPCDTFITESTFGLPIYRWRPQAEIFAQINTWWRANQEQGRTSVLLAYALGKAQRALAGVDPALGPLLVHGTVARFAPAYAAAGFALPPAELAEEAQAALMRGRALIVAPPGAAGSAWLHKFAPASVAFASGWMQIRATRRRRGLERGFVLSDHADWPGLMGAIAATGASRIYVTHGYTGAVVEWLREQGREAHAWPTRFVGYIEESPAAGDTV